MTMSDACPIKGTFFRESFNKLFEFIELSGSANIEKIFFIVAVI